MPLDLDFTESFDYYPDDVNAAGIGVNSTWITSNQTHEMVAGRFGGKALRLDAGGAGTAIRPCHASNAFCPHFAYRISDFTGMSDGVGHRIIAWTSPTDSNDVICSLSLTTIGQVQVWAGNPGGTLLGLADRVVIPGAWTFFALEYIISDTVGRGTLKMNGHTAMNYVGDTKPSAATQAGRWLLNSVGSGSQDFDDFNWVYDEAVTIGENRIQLHEMVSDSDTQFDPLTGVDNFAMINDTNIDGDTSYNSSNTVGAYDRFGMSHITTNPDTIHAFVLMMAARKEDAGTRTIKHQFKLGPTLVDGPDQNLSNTYTWIRAGRLTDPNGDPWLKDNINALLPGYDLVL